MERFADSLTYSKPEPRHRMCAKIDAVSLQQRGKNNFLVRYGMQIKEGLTYSQAAAEFGACLMHQLACDELLDNRLPGDR